MSMFDEPSKEEQMADQAAREHQKETWHRIGYATGRALAMMFRWLGNQGIELDNYLDKHTPPKSENQIKREQAKIAKATKEPSKYDRPKEQDA